MAVVAVIVVVETDLQLATVAVERVVSMENAATVVVGAEAASKTRMKTKKASFRRRELSPSLRDAAVAKATEVAAKVASAEATVETVASVVSVARVTVAMATVETVVGGDSREVGVDIAAVRIASPTESSHRPSSTKLSTSRLSSSEE